MPVLALMYHRTPRAEVTSGWDTPLPVFRAQIETLLEHGVRFIPFREATDRRRYADETFVTLTFDDGHESNLDALEHLARLGIVGTALVVTDWIADPPAGFFDRAQLMDAAALGDIGAHGATHGSLTSLSADDLQGELTRSKATLEDLLQRRTMTMSLPGGMKSAAVVAAASGAGFDVIGSSVALCNRRPSNPVHRVCLGFADSAAAPLGLVRKSHWSWAGRAARLTAARAATRVLGEARYGRLRGRAAASP